MPDFGTPIAAPTFDTLSNLMGLQQKQQAIQSGALGIQQQQQLQVGANEAQKAQQTQAERGRFTQMLQSGKDDQGNDIRDAQGNPDPAKILPALGRIAPLTGSQMAQGIIATHTAKVGLQAAATSLSSQQRQVLAGQIQAIATNPNDPDIVNQASGAIDQWAQEHPEMAPVAANAKTLLGHIQTAQDPAMRSKLATSLSAMLQGGQQVQTQPQSATVNDGQEMKVGTVAPPVTGGGFTPTTAVQMQPPPTTSVINPKTGASELYGAHPAPASGPIATSLPPGAAGNMENNVNEMNRHFATLQDTSTGAPLVNALRGNIKALGGAAITGTESDRKAYMNGLFNAFGLGDKASGDMQTDTDLLSKQLAQLNLTSPASSDAARALIGAARPNSHMTAAAQSEAADQFASQVQANMAIRNKLAPLKMSNNGQGDPVAYQAQRQQLEQIADPRAWQYMNLGPGTPAAKQFLSKLKPADKARLGGSVDALEKAGMLQ